jgi:hypothetical protein
MSEGHHSAGDWLLGDGGGRLQHSDTTPAPQGLDGDIDGLRCGGAEEVGPHRQGVHALRSALFHRRREHARDRAALKTGKGTGRERAWNERSLGGAGEDGLLRLPHRSVWGRLIGHVERL